MTGSNQIPIARHAMNLVKYGKLVKGLQHAHQAGGGLEDVADGAYHLTFNLLGKMQKAIELFDCNFDIMAKGIYSKLVGAGKIKASANGMQKGGGEYEDASKALKDATVALTASQAAKALDIDVGAFQEILAQPRMRNLFIRTVRNQLFGKDVTDLLNSEDKFYLIGDNVKRDLATSEAPGRDAQSLLNEYISQSVSISKDELIINSNKLKIVEKAVLDVQINKLDQYVVALAKLTYPRIKVNPDNRIAVYPIKEIDAAYTAFIDTNGPWLYGAHAVYRRLDNKISDETHKLAVLTAERNVLVSQLEAAKAPSASDSKIVLELQARIESLTIELDDAISHVNMRDVTADNMKENTKDLKAEIANLNVQLQAAKASAASATMASTEVTNSLTQRIQKVIAALKNNNLELTSKTAELAASSTSNTQLNSQISELTAARNLLTDKLQAAQLSVASGSKSIEELHTYIAHLQSDLNIHSSEYDNLQLTSTSNSAAVVEKKAQITALTSQIFELTAQLDAQKVAATGEIAKNTADNLEVNELWKGTNKDYKLTAAKIVALKEKIRLRNKLIEDQQAKIESLEKQLAACAQPTSGNSSDANELRETKRNLTTTRESLDEWEEFGVAYRNAVEKLYEHLGITIPDDVYDINSIGEVIMNTLSQTNSTQTIHDVAEEQIIANNNVDTLYDSSSQNPSSANRSQFEINDEKVQAKATTKPTFTNAFNFEINDEKVQAKATIKPTFTNAFNFKINDEKVQAKATIKPTFTNAFDFEINDEKVQAKATTKPTFTNAFNFKINDEEDVKNNEPVVTNNTEFTRQAYVNNVVDEKSSNTEYDLSANEDEAEEKYPTYNDNSATTLEIENPKDLQLTEIPNQKDELALTVLPQDSSYPTLKLQPGIILPSVLPPLSDPQSASDTALIPQIQPSIYNEFIEDDEEEKYQQIVSLNPTALPPVDIAPLNPTALLPAVIVPPKNIISVSQQSQQAMLEESRLTIAKNKAHAIKTKHPKAPTNLSRYGARNVHGGGAVKQRRLYLAQ